MRDRIENAAARARRAARRRPATPSDALDRFRRAAELDEYRETTRVSVIECLVQARQSPRGRGRIRAVASSCCASELGRRSAARDRRAAIERAARRPRAGWPESRPQKPAEPLARRTRYSQSLKSRIKRPSRGSSAMTLPGSIQVSLAAPCLRRRRPPRPRWLLARSARAVGRRAPRARARAVHLGPGRATASTTASRPCTLLGFQPRSSSRTRSRRQRFDRDADRATLALRRLRDLRPSAPTPADLAALTALGMPVLPPQRERARGAQRRDVRAGPGGAPRSRASSASRRSRCSIPMLARRRRRDRRARRQPSACSRRGRAPAAATAQGVVIAFLDTGINDAAEGSYPGHESLVGPLPRRRGVHARRLGARHAAERQREPRRSAAASAARTAPTSRASRSARRLDRLRDGDRARPRASSTSRCSTSSASAPASPRRSTGASRNRARNWGAPAGYEGIDVINLSLSSLDASDGNDLVSRLAEPRGRARHRRGRVDRATTGDPRHRALAGRGRPRARGRRVRRAAQRPRGGDDLFPTFNNYGPRAARRRRATRATSRSPTSSRPASACSSADGDLLDRRRPVPCGSAAPAWRRRS